MHLILLFSFLPFFFGSNDSHLLLFLSYLFVFHQKHCLSGLLCILYRSHTTLSIKTQKLYAFCCCKDYNSAYKRLFWKVYFYVSLSRDNNGPLNGARDIHDRIFQSTREILKKGNPGNNIIAKLPLLSQILNNVAVDEALTAVLGPDYMCVVFLFPPCIVDKYHFFFKKLISLSFVYRQS